MQNDTKQRKSLSNDDLEALSDDALTEVAGGATGLDFTYQLQTAPVLRIKPGLINGIPEDFAQMIDVQQVRGY